MASGYPPAPASPLPSFWAPPMPQEWVWPPLEPRRRRASPASSPESAAGSLSPAHAPLRPAAPRRRGRLGDGQRQSASQREKLRMRRLARALHMLRRFLPPSVAPAGQTLTKIETLRLATRYIAHLSDLLGLSHQLLARRGAAARARRCCQLCPPGLGCCQPAASPPPACLESLPPPPAAAPSFVPPAPATDAAAWLVAADPYCAVGPPVEDSAGSSSRASLAGAAALPAQVDDFDAQGLPAELLSFLESFLPPEAQD